jgi:hypothetical protein
VALLCGTFYFLTEGLSVLFHDDKPYLKLLKHVDMHLPIDWFFWLAETLGLYQPVEAFHWDWSFISQLAKSSLEPLCHPSFQKGLAPQLVQESQNRRP